MKIMIKDFIKDLKDKEAALTVLRYYGLSYYLTKEIYVLREEGLSSKQIAQKLECHVRTVEIYSDRMEKLEDDFYSKTGVFKH